MIKAIIIFVKSIKKASSGMFALLVSQLCDLPGKSIMKYLPGCNQQPVMSVKRISTWVLFRTLNKWS